MRIISLGQRLREHRGRSHLSQGQVAERLGVSTAAVASWEEGARPSRANAARVRLWMRDGQSFRDEGRAAKREIFARRVVRARVRFGLTQAALAEELDVSGTIVQGWEKGRSYPSALNEERFDQWEKSRSREFEIHRMGDDTVSTGPEKKPASMARKRESVPEKEPEPFDTAVFGRMAKEVDEDFGKCKKPWEYPAGHPKRARYDALRAAAKAKREDV